jgi:hypothetical protein
MAFPSLVPTSRSFESGDYPVKTFKAQNGKEHRILYGSNRTNIKLSLSYANITDANAELFLDHFDEMQGTFQTFTIGGLEESRGGWKGNKDAIGAQTHGNNYRYESPPKLAQVRPGISTVTVNLIGVL